MDTSAIDLLRTLKPEDLRSRLAELEAEESALRLLLRSVVAREQSQRRRKPVEAAAHA